MAFDIIIIKLQLMIAFLYMCYDDTYDYEPIGLYGQYIYHNIKSQRIQIKDKGIIMFKIYDISYKHILIEKKISRMTSKDRKKIINLIRNDKTEYKKIKTIFDYMEYFIDYHNGCELKDVYKLYTNINNFNLIIHQNLYEINPIVAVTTINKITKFQITLCVPFHILEYIYSIFHTKCNIYIIETFNDMILDHLYTNNMRWVTITKYKYKIYIIDKNNSNYNYIYYHIWDNTSILYHIDNTSKRNKINILRYTLNNKINKNIITNINIFLKKLKFKNNINYTLRCFWYKHNIIHSSNKLYKILKIINSDSDINNRLEYNYLEFDEIKNQICKLMILSESRNIQDFNTITIHNIKLL